jgi:hypothetical protein
VRGSAPSCRSTFSGAFTTDTKNRHQTDVAPPSRALKEIWIAWFNLHAELQKAIPKLVAAPFLSAASQARCNNRILLVGKATAGNWFQAEYRRALRRSPDEAVWERLERNRGFVRQKGNSKSFWNLFCRLAALNPDHGLDSVVWSNVAKIGRLKGNPSGRLLLAQEGLAVHTLRAEMREYKPALAMFVVGSDRVLSRVIEQAVEISPNEWSRSEEVDRASKITDVWWKAGRPALLWTRHPQGASRGEVEYWAARVQELISPQR